MVIPIKMKMDAKRKEADNMDKCNGRHHRRHNRGIIDVDELLKESDFKMPSQEVLQEQANLSLAEKLAKETGQQFKLPQTNPVEIERRAVRFLRDQLDKIR